MPEDAHIFPTRLKVKISSKLSYPVGAELLSSTSASIPQSAKIQIAFYDKYDRLQDRGKPYVILRAAYRGEKTHFRESDSRWTIDVYPVPRSHKHMVREKLCEEFLPLVRDWLVENAVIESAHGFRSIFVTYDENNEETLRIGERRTPDVL